MPSTKPRRRIWIVALVVVLAIPVGVGIFIGIRCYNNASYSSAWSDYYKANASSSGAIQSPLAESLVWFEDSSQSIVSRNGLTRPPCGYKDSSGSIVISAEYVACAKRFSEGLAWAAKASGEGVYIHPDGSEAFSIEAIGLFDFSDGLALFRVRGANEWTRDGYVDRSGKVVIPARYRHADDFVDGFALVSEPTLVSDVLDWFVMRTGLSANVCFAQRRSIIDKNGDRVGIERLRSP